MTWVYFPTDGEVTTAGVGSNGDEWQATLVYDHGDIPRTVNLCVARPNGVDLAKTGVSVADSDATVAARKGKCDARPAKI